MGDRTQGVSWRVGQRVQKGSCGYKTPYRGSGELRQREGANGQREGVGVKGGCVCAAEATALSLPGRKEAGKGAAAAAAAAAVEYSVRRGGGEGRNSGASGRRRCGRTVSAG